MRKVSKAALAIAQSDDFINGLIASISEEGDVVRVCYKTPERELPSELNGVKIIYEFNRPPIRFEVQ